jgi:chromosome segregation ATPase
MVMHTKQQLNEMKNEHDQWQDRIRFYKDEISHFNNHLGRLSLSRKSVDLMASVEHFQNQFIRQKEVLDIIRHDFKQHENLIEALEGGSAAEPNDGIQRIHSIQRDKLDQFEHIFHELRNDFNVFLNKAD